MCGRRPKPEAPNTIPTDNLHELTSVDKESETPTTNIEILQPTDQFRFLDRASIPLSPLRPWRTCTVTQVEETKILLGMLPIILSTIFINVCLAQLQTFSIQQATTMDTRLTSSFNIPAASLPVIPLVFMFILVPVYDRIFVPFVRRFTGIRPLQRVGVGLVLSATSMAVAGLVETRRKAADAEKVTVFWLGFQYVVFGLADIFTLVGLLEFFYAESSARMKSLSTAVSWCTVAFGYFGSSLVVEAVNRASGGWFGWAESGEFWDVCLVCVLV